jgi:hypothetical protein
MSIHKSSDSLSKQSWNISDSILKKYEDRMAMKKVNLDNRHSDLTLLRIRRSDTATPDTFINPRHILLIEPFDLRVKGELWKVYFTCGDHILMTGDETERLISWYCQNSLINEL